MNELCRPAAARTVGILLWKAPRACTNDCFVWRLTCTDGRIHDRQSAVSPWTTRLQLFVANTAPWSFAAYMLPFVGLFVLAAFGARSAWLLSAINVFVCSYLGWAAWCFYTAVAGNPWGRWVGFENAIVLNPYVYFTVVGLTALINVRAFFRGIELLFLRHPAEPVVALALWADQPVDADALHAAMTHDLEESLHPDRSIYYYRRQTDKAHALKALLDADARLAEAAIRRERARRQLSD